MKLKLKGTIHSRLFEHIKTMPYFEMQINTRYGLITCVTCGESAKDWQQWTMHTKQVEIEGKNINNKYILLTNKL